MDLLIYIILVNINVIDLIGIEYVYNIKDLIINNIYVINYNLISGLSNFEWLCIMGIDVIFDKILNLSGLMSLILLDILYSVYDDFILIKINIFFKVNSIDFSYNGVIMDIMLFKILLEFKSLNI